MSQAIATVFSALSKSPYSHNSGLARVASSMLTSCRVKHDVLWTSDDPVPWDKFDTIYLYHGYDLNGVLGLNVFGGVTEANVAKLKKLANFRGRVIPIWYPLPDYAAFAWNARWRDHFTKAEHTALTHLVANQPTPLKNPMRSKHLVVGDSHAPSVWVKEADLEVWSGTTMHNIVTSNRLDRLMDERRDVEKLTVYFGNIDVRHHLCRQPVPTDAARELVTGLVQKLEAICRVLSRLNIELVQLLPIEAETRSIPGPGCYKGQPFHGSHAQRSSIREFINSELERHAAHHRGWSFYAHPAEWVTSGELNQDFMERPRSVHIAPAFYRAFR